jgi:hypothetical protein
MDSLDKMTKAELIIVGKSHGIPLPSCMTKKDMIAILDVFNQKAQPINPKPSSPLKPIKPPSPVKPIKPSAPVKPLAPKRVPFMRPVYMHNLPMVLNKHSIDEFHSLKSQAIKDFVAERKEIQHINKLIIMYFHINGRDSRGVNMKSLPKSKNFVVLDEARSSNIPSAIMEYGKKIGNGVLLREVFQLEWHVVDGKMIAVAIADSNIQIKEPKYVQNKYPFIERLDQNSTLISFSKTKPTSKDINDAIGNVKIDYVMLVDYMIPYMMNSFTPIDTTNLCFIRLDEISRQKSIRREHIIDRQLYNTLTKALPDGFKEEENIAVLKNATGVADIINAFGKNNMDDGAYISKVRKIEIVNIQNHSYAVVTMHLD